MLTPFGLESAWVGLEPLTPGHAAPLAAAAAADRSSYRYTWVPDGLAGARGRPAALGGRDRQHLVRRAG